MQTLLAGADSQVERGTEAVNLLSSIVESAKLLQAEQLQVAGQCICTILSAVSQGRVLTPTTFSNLLACLELQQFAGKLLANPKAESGLARQATGSEEVKEEGQKHVADLLGLAFALFSRAGGHIAGKDVIATLLSPETQTEGNRSLQLFLHQDHPDLFNSEQKKSCKACGG